MLANLVDNAIEYTPAGGKVAVNARRDGSVVRLDVVGYRHRDRIARPAAHLGSALSRRPESNRARAGTRLKPVRAIVAAHGGPSMSSAEPGRGSTFTVRLPAERQFASITRV